MDGLRNGAGSAVEFSLAPHYCSNNRGFLLSLAVLMRWRVGWRIRSRIRHLRERYDLIVAERSRIARELHDTLIRVFSGITMAMQALAGRLRSSGGARHAGGDYSRCGDLPQGDTPQCRGITRRARSRAVVEPRLRDCGRGPADHGNQGRQAKLHLDKGPSRNSG